MGLLENAKRLAGGLGTAILRPEENRMANLLENCRRLDYDPDQPRDENGRWGEGGGKSGGTSRSQPSERNARAFEKAGMHLLADLTSLDSVTEKMGVDLTPEQTGRLLAVDQLPEGSTPRYVSVESLPDKPGFRILASYTVPGAVGALTLDRQFYTDKDGKTVVSHEKMILPKELQRTGLGTRLFAAQVDEYRRLGFSRIDTEATHVGQYQWSRLGFSTDDKAMMKLLRKEAVSFAVKIGKVPRTAAEESLSQVTSLHELSSLQIAGAKTAFGDSVGKAYLLHSGAKDSTTIPMQFDLSDGSVSMRNFRSKVPR